MSLCVFRSIETHELGLKKKIRFDLFKPLFQNFFLSLRLSKAPQQFFCRFPPNFLQGFSLPKPICLFYPSFLHCFSCFMHFFMGFGYNFRTMHVLGFLMNQTLFCEIDQWVLLPQWYILDLWWLIWSIWGFVIIRKF